MNQEYFHKKTSEETPPQPDWRQWMQSALIHPETVKREEVERRFTPGAHLPAIECLRIYQRGYTLRLTQCLAEQFPALRKTLGETLFKDFAKRYLRVYPSDSYTLYELGRRFPDFLEEDRPDRESPPEHRERWIDFMVDLAKYERLHFKLFDAPGHEGSPWPDVSIPDEALIPQPCLALAAYRYPVAWYYHAIKDTPHVPLPPAKTSYIVLIRKNYQVTTFPITEIHYQFLQKFQATRQISEALNHVAEKTGFSLDQVERSWRDNQRDQWIQAGFFISRNAT